jgi:hypothetical protein
MFFGGLTKGLGGAHEMVTVGRGGTSPCRKPDSEGSDWIVLRRIDSLRYPKSGAASVG